MNKELSELNVIRLQTEMENCIGFMTHAQRTNDFNEYLRWDVELNNIIREIESLGE